MKHDTGWMADAVCADMDPDLFFPSGMSVVPEAAAAACARCPVRQTCGDYARATRSSGVWGGRLFREASRSQPGEVFCRLCDAPIGTDGRERYCSPGCRAEGRRRSHQANRARRQAS